MTNFVSNKRNIHHSLDEDFPDTLASMQGQKWSKHSDFENLILNVNRHHEDLLNNQTSSGRSLSSNIRLSSRKGDILKLPGSDMHHYGIAPKTEALVVSLCNACNAILKAPGLERHLNTLACGCSASGRTGSGSGEVNTDYTISSMSNTDCDGDALATMQGQKWSEHCDFESLIQNVNRQHEVLNSPPTPTSNSSTIIKPSLNSNFNKSYKGEILKLLGTDMHRYGIAPKTGAQVVSICSICNAILKAPELERHMKAQHLSSLRDVLATTSVNSLSMLTSPAGEREEANLFSLVTTSTGNQTYSSGGAIQTISNRISATTRTSASMSVRSEASAPPSPKLPATPNRSPVAIARSPAANRSPASAIASPSPIGSAISLGGKGRGRSRSKSAKSIKRKSTTLPSVSSAPTSRTAPLIELSSAAITTSTSPTENSNSPLSMCSLSSSPPAGSSNTLSPSGSSNATIILDVTSTGVQTSSSAISTSSNCVAPITLSSPLSISSSSSSSSSFSSSALGSSVTSSSSNASTSMSLLSTTVVVASSPSQTVISSPAAFSNSSTTESANICNIPQNIPKNHNNTITVATNKGAKQVSTLPMNSFKTTTNAVGNQRPVFDLDSSNSSCSIDSERRTAPQPLKDYTNNTQASQIEPDLLKSTLSMLSGTSDIEGLLGSSVKPRMIGNNSGMVISPVTSTSSPNFATANILPNISLIHLGSMAQQPSQQQQEQESQEHQQQKQILQHQHRQQPQQHPAHKQQQQKPKIQDLAQLQQNHLPNQAPEQQHQNLLQHQPDQQHNQQKHQEKQQQITGTINSNTLSILSPLLTSGMVNNQTINQQQQQQQQRIMHFDQQTPAIVQFDRNVTYQQQQQQQINNTTGANVDPNSILTLVDFDQFAQLDFLNDTEFINEILNTTDSEVGENGVVNNEQPSAKRQRLEEDFSNLSATLNGDTVCHPNINHIQGATVGVGDSNSSSSSSTTSTSFPSSSSEIIPTLQVPPLAQHSLESLQGNAMLNDINSLLGATTDNSQNIISRSITMMPTEMFNNSISIVNCEPQREIATSNVMVPSQEVSVNANELENLNNLNPTQFQQIIYQQQQQQTQQPEQQQQHLDDLLGTAYQIYNIPGLGNENDQYSQQNVIAIPSRNNNHTKISEAPNGGLDDTSSINQHHQQIIYEIANSRNLFQASNVANARQQQDLYTIQYPENVNINFNDIEMLNRANNCDMRVMSDNLASVMSSTEVAIDTASLKKKQFSDSSDEMQHNIKPISNEPASNSSSDVITKIKGGIAFFNTLSKCQQSITFDLDDLEDDSQGEHSEKSENDKENDGMLCRSGSTTAVFPPICNNANINIPKPITMNSFGMVRTSNGSIEFRKDILCTRKVNDTVPPTYGSYLTDGRSAPQCSGSLLYIL